MQGAYLVLLVTYLRMDLVHLEILGAILKVLNLGGPAEEVGPAGAK